MQPLLKIISHFQISLNVKLQTKPSSLKVGPKRKGCNEPKPLSRLFPGEVGRAPTLCAGRTGDKPQRPHAPNRKEQPGEGAGEGRST